MDESDEYKKVTYWREWHLTPAGWQKGSYNTSESIEKIEPPADRVLTGKFEHNGSPRLGFIASPPAILWKIEDKNKINRLLKKHGKMPRKT